MRASICALAIAALAASPSPKPVEGTADAEFSTRLAGYLKLHRKLEAALPALPNDATPKQIDDHRRALGDAIRKERLGAKRGELFTPKVQALERKTLETLLAGPGGAAIKASIMDENPGGLALAVNDRYPDSMPVSTMPPQVLESLPKLEEDLEYRFVGKRLVLMDPHAHLIVDFTDEILP